MNLNLIVKALQDERVSGEAMTAELIERIDIHIRDLQTLKAWVKDSGYVRALAIEGLLNGEPEPEQPTLPFADTP